MSSEEEKQKEYSEPDYAKSGQKKSTDYPFYIPGIDKHLIPETRKLLENYSKVPPDQQSKHVHEIRDQAWAIRAYPCTGLGVWLAPYLPHSPAYSTIVKRLQDGDIFMDIGCHLGGEMRTLVFDGAPSENMYGVDIASHWDVGFEMYRDKGRFNAHFIEADFLSSDNPALLALDGRVDIISISAVLHQWDWKQQVEGAKKLVAFSKSGSLVVGHQIGNVEAMELFNQTFKVAQWRHTPESFEKMWDEVGAKTGTTWETKACHRVWEDMGWDPKDQALMEPGVKVLDFVVTRTH